MARDKIFISWRNWNLYRHDSTQYHREFAAVWKRRDGLRVPGHAGQLFFARFPLGAGEDARGDFDKSRSELEDGGGVPGAAIAGAVFTDVERIGHAGEGNVLDDHFGEEAESLHFERVVFQVEAIGADAQAEGDFLRGGERLIRLGG